MPSLLSNRLAKRVLRPAFTMVEQNFDQRLERATSAFQSDLDALQHEVSDLRRQQYGLSLLLDQAGRDGHRMPTAAQFDTLVWEVRDLAGEQGGRARRDVTVAYRHLVALEALGVGSLAGSLSDVCGRLATVPLLRPPNGDVLEIGTLHGLFAAALQRMLRHADIDARLTIVDPLSDSPTRPDRVRANLSLGGGDTSRLIQGDFADPAVRASADDRLYGVIVVNGDHDLSAVAALAAPGAVVVAPGRDNPGTAALRPLGSVSDSAFLRA
ncbi:class I SAM-dependent methyltransferase [Streptomyces purpureus]|uniref:class I SAM-dependent methyltransferase n=1 Tax=Streptomyces purpureus TaxID=1951 RepID=UPI0037AE421C